MFFPAHLSQKNWYQLVKIENIDELSSFLLVLLVSKCTVRKKCLGMLQAEIDNVWKILGGLELDKLPFYNPLPVFSSST